MGFVCEVVKVISLQITCNPVQFSIMYISFVYLAKDTFSKVILISTCIFDHIKIVCLKKIYAYFCLFSVKINENVWEEGEDDNITFDDFDGDDDEIEEVRFFFPSIL